MLQLCREGKQPLKTKKLQLGANPTARNWAVDKAPKRGLGFIMGIKAPYPPPPPPTPLRVPMSLGFREVHAP